MASLTDGCGLPTPGPTGCARSSPQYMPRKRSQTWLSCSHPASSWEPYRAPPSPSTANSYKSFTPRGLGRVRAKSTSISHSYPNFLPWPDLAFSAAHRGLYVVLLNRETNGCSCSHQPYSPAKPNGASLEVKNLSAKPSSQSPVVQSLHSNPLAMPATHPRTNLGSRASEQQHRKPTQCRPPPGSS